MMDARDHLLLSNEIAYLAGLLEAEGAFIAGTPSKPRSPLLILGMTDQDVIDRVAGLLGVTSTTVRPGKEGWKTVYRVHLNGGRATSFLQLIQPFMGRRRQEQLRVAIACYQPKYFYPHHTYSRVESSLDECDRQWLAGYSEGEGYFATINQRKRYGEYHYPVMVLSSTDYDVLERARDVIGSRYGVKVSVTGATSRGSHKPIWRVKITGSSAHTVCVDLHPLMGARRQKRIEDILGLQGDYPSTHEYGESYSYSRIG